MSDSRLLAVLIAEADELVRMVTADMLADVGFQTIEVSTATEALAVLQGSVTVRMLITGRGIVGDGVALAHLVHHRWPDVGILVTSGAGADLQRALPPGTRLLSKPYVFADLIQEVKAGLAKEQDEPSTAPVLPSGVPPHRGANLGNGVGAVAGPATEPDKT
ncbi:response regulator [Methylobacterium pseudosasicola]|uniref:CheY chemotaxis protein or a CheY-like REC (Receiver) domain n=1 Tax=Methylobacterium pseudosasicola TaxID=582667 RepID=A0A1I4HWI4_9HYPH|nr:response regulator [Methylobacterium pseudosasicola]SFL46424.1 CheY chemotaxis protein or a CheY-like REC (receiver) domain [Methylobacterium pseudosasicola]